MKKNIDLLDKKILYELDFDSRMSVTTLAKRVHTSKEKANFRVKRLIHNGFIKGFITTLFTSHLNRFYYKLFYKFNKTTPDLDSEILTFLNNYPKTAWLGSFEGPYDLALLIFAESIYDLDSFLTLFRERFGKYIFEQEIHTLTETHRFNLKFFYDGKRRLHVQYPKTLRNTSLDSLDRNILCFLANDARVPVIAIAKKEGVDPSTILYRIKRLRKDKVLGTHTLVVDFQKFGMQHFQVNFKLKEPSSAQRLISFFSEHRNATFATVTLGKYDLAIELVVEDNVGLRKILDDVKKHFTEEIIDHDTFLIIKEHKITWLPFGN